VTKKKKESIIANMHLVPKEVRLYPPRLRDPVCGVMPLVGDIAFAGLLQAV